MTPDQFNAALARCIEAEARPGGELACYPAIGLTGNANGVVFWDNERHIVSAGVFSEIVNQNAIDRAIAYASSRPISDIIGDAVPCIVTPHDAPITADIDDIVLYCVALSPDGLLEFADEEALRNEDDEDFHDYYAE